jgi:hypothetical protein
MISPLKLDRCEVNPNVIVVQGVHLLATNEDLNEFFQWWTAYKAFWKAESVRIDELLRRLSAARRQAALLQPAKRRRPKPLKRVVWPRTDQLQIEALDAEKNRVFK